MAKHQTYAAKGSFGQLSQVCGNPISGEAHRAISGLRGTSLIATAPCYSTTQNDATPISQLPFMNVCWFRFTPRQERPVRSGCSLTMINANSMLKMNGSWSPWENLLPQLIKR